MDDNDKQALADLFAKVLASKPLSDVCTPRGEARIDAIGEVIRELADLIQSTDPAFDKQKWVMSIVMNTQHNWRKPHD